MNQNPESTDSQVKVKRDYLFLAREILKALRKADLIETDLRVALMILENGHCLKRQAAIFLTHQELAELDGEMDRPQVTKSINRLAKKKVIEKTGGVYTFRPPGEWRAGARAREGRQARQLELELRLDRLAQQLDLDLWELNATLRDHFLDGSRVSPTHPGVWETPRECVSPTRPGVESTPSKAPHTYVESTSTGSIKRITLDASDAESKRIWEDAMAFFRGDQRVRIQEELNKNTWLVAASIKVWPQPLEQVIAACKDGERTGYPTTENRAARAFHALKEKLGEKWLDYFPNTKATLTFGD